MIIQTDVKCLYCGHVSWRIEMERGAAWRTAEMVWPEASGTLPTRPRCTRCDGPVYLDGDYQQVRVRLSERRARLQSMKSGAHVPNAAPSEREPVSAPQAA